MKFHRSLLSGGTPLPSPVLIANKTPDGGVIGPNALAAAVINHSNVGIATSGCVFWNKYLQRDLYLERWGGRGGGGWGMGKFTELCVHSMLKSLRGVVHDSVQSLYIFTNVLRM